MKAPRILSRQRTLDQGTATRDVVAIVKFLHDGSADEVVSFLRKDPEGPVDFLKSINEAIREHKINPNYGIESIPFVGQLSKSILRQSLIALSRIYEGEERIEDLHLARETIDSFLVQLVQLSSIDTIKALREIAENTPDISKGQRTKILDLIRLCTPP